MEQDGRLSPFDGWLFWRTLGAATLALAAATLIAVATDESAITAGMRLARAAALVPVAAAIGALSVVAHAKARGETRAVSGLGVSPWRAVGGARAAALVFGLLTPLFLLLPSSDARSLFPTAHAPAQWAVAEGSALDRADGVTISADGSISLVPAAVPPSGPVPGRWAALLCLWPLSLSVPDWAVTPMALAARSFTVIGTAGISVLVLHAIAANRIGAWAGVLAVVPLLFAIATERARK